MGVCHLSFSSQLQVLCCSTVDRCLRIIRVNRPDFIVRGRWSLLVINAFLSPSLLIVVVSSFVHLKFVIGVFTPELPKDFPREENLSRKSTTLARRPRREN